MTDRATMPESLQIPSPKSIRLMYTRETKGLFFFFETIATTQMAILADSLAEIGRLWSIAANELSNVSPRRPRKFIYRNDAIYTLNDVYQPMTTAICWAYRDKLDLQGGLLENIIDVPIAASLCNGTQSGAAYSIPHELATNINNYKDNETSSPFLKFMELPPEKFGNNTIGALISFPPSWPGGSNLLTCTIDARWMPVNLQSTREIMKVVRGQPAGWPAKGLCDSSKPSVKVTSEWTQYLNPHIQSSNRTVFETILDSVAVQPSEWTDDIGFVQGLMESILTTIVTSGLSRTASSATIQGSLKNCPDNNCDEVCGVWCLDMMPKSKQEFGYGGNIYDLSGIDLSRLSKFTVQVDVNGYAYNSRGATTILSCTVLILYCILTAMHIIFVLIKRTNSNAWDTASEVTALAMQSQPTQALKNTCAGISTSRIFSNLVRVVRTGAERAHLELDFGDHDSGYGEPLVEDDFYG